MSACECGCCQERYALKGSGRDEALGCHCDDYGPEEWCDCEFCLEMLSRKGHDDFIAMVRAYGSELAAVGRRMAEGMAKEPMPEEPTR